MLFIDYSSAFNTIGPSKLITKLRTLGLNTSLCNWILDFLTGLPQVVRVGNNTSATPGLITNNDKTAYREEVKRPGLVVPGQQPLSQRDQDKGDDCGLQEKEDRARPPFSSKGL